MKKILGKLKKSDYIVIGVVAVVMLLAVAAYQLVSRSRDSASTAKTTVQIDIELSDVEQSVKNAFQNIIGKSATYGVTFTDKCVVKSVRAEQAKRVTTDVENGAFIMADVPGKYRMIITLEAELYENEYEFRGDNELVVAGKQLQVHAKGAAFTGYVIDVRVVKGSEV